MCFHLKIWTAQEMELQVMSKAGTYPSPAVQNSNTFVEQYYLFFKNPIWWLYIYKSTPFLFASCSICHHHIGTYFPW